MIRTRQQGDTPFFPNMLNNGKVEVCLKEDVDKVIAGLERKVALLHRECIRHKLETTHLRFSFWHSQREWWESEDRGDNKPLFDYAAKEQSCVRLMCRLRKKLEAK